MQFMVQVVRSKRTDEITLTLKLDDVEVLFWSSDQTSGSFFCIGVFIQLCSWHCYMYIYMYTCMNCMHI